MIESFLNYLQLLLSIGGVVLIALLFQEIKVLKHKLTQVPEVNAEGNRLKLQALERLTLLAERTGLKNLVSRIDGNGLNASDYHFQLVEAIRSEYDYNISQQIYISPEVWNAVTRLKDQNIYVINHITANLNHNASAADLSRLILEYTMTPNAEMHLLVLDALQFEAKNILS
jgi:hypothetical protein